jgi:hypothetical protein
MDENMYITDVLFSGKFHRWRRWSLAVERIYLFLWNWPGLINRIIILATLVIKITYETEQLRGENTIQCFVCAISIIYWSELELSKLLSFDLTQIYQKCFFPMHSHIMSAPFCVPFCEHAQYWCLKFLTMIFLTKGQKIH